MTTVSEARALLREAQARDRHDKERRRREAEKIRRIERDAQKEKIKHTAEVLRALRLIVRDDVVIEYDAYESISLKHAGYLTLCISAQGGDGTTYLSVNEGDRE